MNMENNISFNWDIHWLCNYRCPYCWFYGKWDDLKRENLNLGTEELIKFWQNIYDRYGAVKIAITGGEPFIYPDFVSLISQLVKLHKLEVVTNLSVDITSFLIEDSLENLEIRPSFHPGFADFESFVRQFLLLRKKKPQQEVSIVAWPPYIEKLKFYQRKFSDQGINIFTQPFFGEYNGIKYPGGYTNYEKEIIGPSLGGRGGETFKTELVPTKGRLCAAGQRYAVIHPHGRILRCGGLNPTDSSKMIIGNLKDENFQLLSQPQPCICEICPCNEWASLLVN